MTNHDPDSCKLDETMNVIVGKWKLSILYLLFQGTKRFSELQHGIPDITKKMLTSQLRELEEQDIIRRVVYAVVPPKVEYSLTEYGRTLEPILKLIHEWGGAHEKHMQAKQERLAKEAYSGELPEEIRKP
jgi:DNA-binding HxlR family transcriptional regulator